MKKAFVLLLTMAFVYVSYADDVSAEQLARVKSIAAYHVNKLSLSELFPDDTCPEQVNIEIIKERIKHKSYNEILTDFIAQSNPRSRDVNVIYNYYTSTLFADSIFIDFFNRDSNRKVLLQNRLKAELASLLQVSVEDEEESNSPDTGNQGAEEPPDPKTDLFSVLSFILVILALGAAVYLFLELNKVKREFDKKNYHRKESIYALDKRLAQLDDDLAKIKSQISDMKRQVTENRDKVNNMQRNSELVEESVRSQSFSRGSVRQKPVVREFYAGVPSSGCFRTSDTYSAKTLYKIIAKTDSIGEFEFIDRPEAVAVAQQSKTSFLDPACNVVNDDLVNFSRIVTERKGTVERTDDGWKIVKKADIRLA